MESSESPFSDLDIFADWSGDPADHVEVKLVVEIHCRPFLDKPVLNTRLPKEFVVDSSIQLAPPKATLAQLNDREPVERNSLTPERPIVNTDAGNSSIHPEYSSEQGIFLLDSPNDKYQSATLVSNVYTDPQEKHPLGNILHSRKRSAKTASLPDSISDSERPIRGIKNIRDNGSLSIHMSGALSNESKLNRPSLIPRPVGFFSHSHQASAPGRIPILNSGSGSECGSGYLLREKLAAMRKSTENVNVNSAPNTNVGTPRIDGGDGFMLSSSLAAIVDNTFDNAVNNLTEKAINKADDSSLPADGPADVSESRSNTLSNVVSCGTPCDIHNILDSYGAVDDYPNGPVEPLFSLQTPRSPLSPYGSFLDLSAPQLIHENGVFRIFCPRDVKPAIYKATISFIMPMEKGTPRGWLNFIIPGLPRLRNNCTGYLYFWTPPSQGIEFRTTYLKRHSLVESCMMGQFPIFEKLVIPVRPCDGRFYGFLKDFKVTQSIRADFADDEDQDAQTWVIKYHVVCTIHLIQRDFWAEKCGLTLYVYGGPDSEFSAHILESLDGFQTVNLNSSPDARIGIAEVQIICSPSNLSMFAITWKVRLPRNSPIWMPRIRGTMDTDGLVEDLEDRYTAAEANGTYEVVDVSPATKPDASTARDPDPGPKSNSTKGLWSVACFVLVFCSMYVVSRITYLLYNEGFFDGSLVIAADSVEETPVVDSPDTAVNMIIPVTDEAPVPAPVVPTVSVASTVPIAPTVPDSPAAIPLRDQVDYLLGWRGPY
ncbi:hypothetical protein N7451_000549 [Penicillium sp. IBT 35674x]|nr:hypothetical protein N7451_000549 [Penicillium sp. IBT 35674x]